MSSTIRRLPSSVVWVVAGFAWFVAGCHASLPMAAPSSQSNPEHPVFFPGATVTAQPQSATEQGVAATPLESEQDYDDESEAIGDDDDSGEGEADVTDEAAARRAHPFDPWSRAELSHRLQAAPESLGSASIGRPNAGRLFNAVQLADDPLLKRANPTHTWATPETIEFLTNALRAVAVRYPGTEPVSIGHLSARHGGPLRPHVSHQSGRDVDVGFYYSKEPSRWYSRATSDNLDVARTWWFIRTLVLETDIEMILVDQSLSKLVERFALSSGEPEEWVQGLFHSRNGRAAVVRHARGHATHLHLRFFNRVAQESGRRLMPLLVERKMVQAPQRTVTHVARSGDTLAKLASRYSTTMQAIRQANSMKTYQLVAGAAYRIPVSGRAVDTPAARVPSRRARPDAGSKQN